jgi:hypothetical protein
MKNNNKNSLHPQGRPEVSDGTNWYSLALEGDCIVDDDIYALLNTLNSEVL